MNPLARAARLCRTLRPLRREQVVGQVVHRARREFESLASLLKRPAPPFPGLRAKAREYPPPLHPNAAPELLRGRFRFLNREGDMGWPPAWDARGLPKLWAYNLHYFDWTWALEFADARLAALDWMETHLPARDACGWEPYPISLRAPNWCGYFLARHREATLADARLREPLWRSLWMQAEWLAAHREFHIGANHLLENAVALAVVGSVFRGAGADRWLKLGVGLLVREIPEQILPDGMHYERSPMYHARMTLAFAALSAVGTPEVRAIVDARLPAMRAALAATSHPDGRIALLNDAAFGIYPEPADLGADPATASRGAWALRDAGYFGWRGDDGEYLVCDAGAIAPDHQPGHAHGDIFSFEWSVGGRRVVVDAGVFDYVAGDMRAWCRSTRAHNTLEIDGAAQCEFWGAFRVGRRGRPRDARWTPSADGFELEAWHDGYRHLGARHRRRFAFRAPGELLVEDFVEIRRAAILRRFLHFAPGSEIRLGNDGRSALVRCGQVAVQAAWTEGTATVGEGWHCPEFGVRERAPLLELRSEASPSAGPWTGSLRLKATVAT